MTQVIQELTIQVKSDTSLHELLHIYQLTVQQAKTIQLNEVQVAHFKAFTIAKWEEYVKNTLGLVPYGAVGWDALFELYAFYQFPAFKQYIQTLPEYNQNMTWLYQKLNPESPKYDKALAERIANTPEGLGIYESIQNNVAVEQKIEQDAKKYTETLEKLPTEEQYAEIAAKKGEKAKVAVGYAQRNSKACANPKNEEEEQKKRFENLKDELLLKVKDREIALAVKQADQARAKFEQQIREKELAELQDIEKSLKTAVEQAQKECKKAQEKCDKAREQVVDAKNKNARTEQELRKIVLEELVPLYNKRAELVEKLEQVQARIYIQKFADKLINQERVRALNNEKIQNASKLTPKAQEMFKKAGYDFVQYQESIQSKLGNQMRVEGISLLNRLAELDARSALSCSIIEATTNLANIMLEASYNHDISLVWATSDLANAALDLTLTTHEAATLSFQHSVSPAEQGVCQGLQTLKLQTIAEDILIAARVVVEGLRTLRSGKIIDPTSLQLNHPNRSDELCRAFASIERSMGSLTSDDVIREVAATMTQMIILGTLARAVKVFTCVANEKFLTTVQLPEMAKARIARSAQSIETAGEFAAAQAKAGEVGALAQAVDAEGVKVAEAVVLGEAQVGESIQKSAGNIAQHIESAGGYITLQHINSSIGNINKLEKAANMFKDMPSAISENGPLTKLLKCSKDPKAFGVARGAAFELEVAYDLVQSGEEVLEFGLKKRNDYIKREFDIITANKYIECKNIDWSMKIGGDVSSLQSQISQQATIARDLGKSFELYSKQPLTQFWREWFESNNIKVIEIKL